MPKVLVTGGAGFIGSHVVERFLNSGYEVDVLDDLSSGRRENLPRNVPLHVYDLGSRAAAELLRQGSFTVLAHLAAQIDVRQSLADPVCDATTNILGTLNLLEVARSMQPTHRPRIVFASTGGALYGDQAPVPTSEAGPTDPNAPYGVAKLTTEHYLAYYGRIWGFDHAVLRFGNVYGPRQTPDGEAGVIAIFTKRLLTNLPLVVYGDGSQTRDYVYVDDVAEAFVVAATRDLPPPGVLESRAFNIGTGTQTSVLEVARMLATAAGVDPTIEYVSARPGELQRSMLDVHKAERVLGWKSKVSLKTGLARTLAWLKAELQLLH